MAKQWRQMLGQIDLKSEAAGLRTDGRPIGEYKSLAEVKEAATLLVDRPAKPHLAMNLLLSAVCVPAQYKQQILERWSIYGYRSLLEYAPYGAHVLRVEIFFRLALASYLISADRPSNRVDISYLHYLPFCHVFVSSDRLHRQCAPLFLRSDQRFLWGQDLKADLARLNTHYLDFPEDIRNRGIANIANTPPATVAPVICEARDAINRGWRERAEKPIPPLSEKTRREIVDDQKLFADAPETNDLPVPDERVSSMTLERRYHRKKGSWYQIPKDFDSKKSSGG
jgi:hypothetical protein